MYLIQSIRETIRFSILKGLEYSPSVKKSCINYSQSSMHISNSQYIALEEVSKVLNRCKGRKSQVAN